MGEVPAGEKLTDEESRYTFQNKDPGPSAKTSHAPHLHDAKGQQTSKRTSSRGGGEEDGHAEATLVTLVPHGDAAQQR